MSKRPMSITVVCPERGRLSPPGLAEQIRHLGQQIPGLVELELCGVRDGDALWHGSNPLDGLMRELLALLDEWWARDIRLENDNGSRCYVEHLPERSET